MNAIAKQKRLKSYLERKYMKVVEEAYNIKYTDHEKSDVLAYEALQLDKKLKFLQF